MATAEPPAPAAMITGGLEAEAAASRSLRARLRKVTSCGPVDAQRVVVFLAHRGLLHGSGLDTRAPRWLPSRTGAQRAERARHIALALAAGFIERGPVSLRLITAVSAGAGLSDAIGEFTEALGSPHGVLFIVLDTVRPAGLIVAGVGGPEPTAGDPLAAVVAAADELGSVVIPRRRRGTGWSLSLGCAVPSQGAAAGVAAGLALADTLIRRIDVRTRPPASADWTRATAEATPSRS